MTGEALLPTKIQRDTIAPHPEERRSRVSKDEAPLHRRRNTSASWFETRGCAALLTMRMNTPHIRGAAASGAHRTRSTFSVIAGLDPAIQLAHHTT